MNNELSESEEKFRSLVENLNEIVYTLDENAKITYVSPNIYALSSYTLSEITGRSLIDFVHPDDIEGRIEQFRKAISGMNEATEYRFLTKDGQIKWVRTAARPTIKDGKIIGVQGVLTDITDRKRIEEELRKSEEKYRVVFENTGTATVIIEENTTISLVNKRFEELSGYARKEIEGKMSWTDFVVKDDLEKMKKYHRARRKDKKEVPTRYEFRFVDRDGKIHNILIDVDVIPGTTKSIASLLDITDRRQAEEKQKKLQAQLLSVQKLESVGRLAGGVAHDLNNVLGAILGHADLARMELSQEDPLYKRFSTISDLSEKGARITRQLVAFTGSKHIKPKKIDMSELISDMLKLLVKTLEEHICITFNRVEKLRTVLVDPGQMDQVILNLCINARDAMPEGGNLVISTRNITIGKEYEKIHVSAKPGQYVLVSISDSGAGIAPQHIDKIFDPFFTTKGTEEGTGLGLSVVHGIVGQHNGFVKVYSEVGVGTTFNIYLPAVEGEPDVEMSKKVRKIPKGSGTILVVEDDECILNMIDLVISDIVMPKISGKEVYEHVRSVTPDVRFLFTSGYTAEVIKK